MVMTQDSWIKDKPNKLKALIRAFNRAPSDRGRPNEGARVWAKQVVWMPMHSRDHNITNTGSALPCRWAEHSY